MRVLRLAFLDHVSDVLADVFLVGRHFIYLSQGAKTPTLELPQPGY
jgi:hypothetical protein